MKERIKKIMDDQHLSPSAFADKLQIGRAVISHILNGRNNPSLDVVIRILTEFSNVNPDWLLTGVGDTYKSEGGISISQKAYQPDLFLHEQSPINEAEISTDSKNEIENVNENKEVDSKFSANKIQEPMIPYGQKVQEKRILRIIIYYSDNTFEIFNADNRPL